MNKNKHDENTLWEWIDNSNSVHSLTRKEAEMKY